MHQNPENTVTRKYQSTPCRQVPAPGFFLSFFIRKRGTFLGPFLGPSLLASCPTQIPGCPRLVPNVDTFLVQRCAPFWCPFLDRFLTKIFTKWIPNLQAQRKTTVQGPQGGTRGPTGNAHTKSNKKVQKSPELRSHEGSKMVPTFEPKKIRSAHQTFQQPAIFGAGARAAARSRDPKSGAALGRHGDESGGDWLRARRFWSESDPPRNCNKKSHRQTQGPAPLCPKCLPPLKPRSPAPLYKYAKIPGPGGACANREV